jgi:hypothetical protein
MAELEGPKFYARYYLLIEPEQWVPENVIYVGFYEDNK